MPYDDERTNHLGQSGIASDRGISVRLQSLNVRPSETSTNDLELVDASNITTRSPADRVVAVDGSRQEVPVGENHHNAKVGFIEVAVADVNTKYLREQQSSRFVESGVASQAADPSSIRMVMPGQNVHFHDEPIKSSWRKMLFDNFQSKDVNGVRLLDIYTDLIKYQDERIEAGKLSLKKCPECGLEPDPIYLDQPSDCSQCGGRLYPTDCLRIHEDISNHQTNEHALTLLMQVVEQLALAVFIRDYSDKQTAFLKDGPLAQFNRAKMIKSSMRSLIEDAREDCNQPFVVTGLHKTGEFMTLARKLRDKIPPRTVVPLTTSDIYENVVIGRSRDEEDTFGENTYYGKNFIYKSEGGYMFPLTLPRQSDRTGRLLHQPSKYPAIGQTLTTLDDLEFALYEDSAIPIHMAHSYATIPEKIGSKVLSELAEKELMGANRNYNR